MENSSLEYLLHAKPITLILLANLRDIIVPFHQMKKLSLEKAPIILLACHEAQIQIKTSARKKQTNKQKTVLGSFCYTDCIKVKL